MQIKIEQAFKLSLIALLTALASFCVISKATSEWTETNILAVASDARHFSQFFHVKPFVHYLFLIAIAVFLGVSASRPLLSYLRRLLNSLLLMGTSWHHYFCATLIGAISGISIFTATFRTLDKWYFFYGDGLLLLIMCFFYGALTRPARSNVVPGNGTPLPEDIIGVSIVVEYISRRIGSAFDTQQGPLPKTLAVAGERGSGKSYILDKVLVKLETELNLQCRIFKPWNFDSHTLFYEEVMGYLFMLLEEKCVVPKPKALVANYINSFCDEPKNAFSAFFGHLFGDFSSEKRTLQDAEMWIKNIGNIVLIFDDLDRCHQSELRHVFRLIDRLSIFPNIFLVASIDNKTVDKIGRFEDRIEIPVKVTS
jgi:hypothetical protein